MPWNYTKVRGECLSIYNYCLFYYNPFIITMIPFVNDDIFWYFFNQCKSMNYRKGFQSSLRKKGNGPVRHLVVPVKLFMVNNIKNDVTLIVDQVGDLFSFTYIISPNLREKTAFDIFWHHLTRTILGDIGASTFKTWCRLGCRLFRGLSRNVPGNPAGLSLRLCCSLDAEILGGRYIPKI